MSIEIDITNVKNIKKASFELPFEKGMYALVGENGCGKSTLMLLLSLIVKTSSTHMLSSKDVTQVSKVIIKIGEKEDIWCINKSGKLTTGKYNSNNQMYSSVHYHGFYEGSIFYGSRFNDYNKIDVFLSKQDAHSKLIDSDPFVDETLGYILHNNKQYYKGLKKINTRSIAKEEGFLGIPYFLDINGNIISQYKMSSGESMLISLIDFINNLVIRGSYDKLLFLIDEVELALHPGAIDRLVTFLNNLIVSNKTDLVVYFSTHSAELIQRISAKNIFLVENNNGDVDLINPCYPNYAIRNLYIPNGFDFILLVEDELAKALVEKVMRENQLYTSKLCCVLPAGGCDQMAKLHNDMLIYNTLGVGKKIISIYDGDVLEHISKNEKYKSLIKCFLPIKSIEKYLKKKCIDQIDKKFIKLIGDKYFNQRSLQDIIDDYKNDERTKNGRDNNGKNFYAVILSNLLKVGINEEKFIQYICEDIYCYEDLTKFIQTLKKMLY